MGPERTTRYDQSYGSYPLQTSTLGHFSVRLNGAKIHFRGKAQNKPVQLLQVLIAFGGKNVSEFLITESLWPDSEGDQAHSAYTTTLSRLRKMIGPDALHVQQGHLSLNDQYCWVDTWVLEALLNKLGRYLENDSQDEKVKLQQLIEELFALNRGLFLEKENAVGWMLPLRERLRSRFMRIIKLLIAYYRHHGSDCRKVITLYEKAREFDPLSEEYCRGLMRCHSAQGNRSEALALFERCHQMLKQTFGIKPSQKTLHLYETIKAEPEVCGGFCELCAQAPK